MDCDDVVRSGAQWRVGGGVEGVRGSENSLDSVPDRFQKIRPRAEKVSQRPVSQRPDPA